MEKATRQHIKEHNTNLVLKTIYQQASVSRAEVARLTRLTRTTVSDIVAELMRVGLVNEIGTGSSRGGKPPIQVKLAENARQMVCVDLSNGDYRGAVLNLRGEILRRNSWPLEGRKGASALELVFRLIDELIEAATAPMLGIGIGTPGRVDARHGLVIQSVNRQWAGLRLRDFLEDRYHLPAYIANDSQVAALAEYTFSEQHHVSNLVLIRSEEGIGSGVVLDGQMFGGDGSSAGEIGHLTIDPEGPVCTCGNRGCLETFASTRTILEKAVRMADQQPDSEFYAFLQSSESSIQGLARAIAAGNPQACQIAAETGRFLGAAIASQVSILNIHKIILSGTTVLLGQPLLEEVLTEVKHRCLPAMAAETEVCFSTLGEDIIILGASTLVLQGELGLP